MGHVGNAPDGIYWLLFALEQVPLGFGRTLDSGLVVFNTPACRRDGRTWETIIMMNNAG